MIARPVSIPADPWQLMIANSRAFLATWAEQAHRLGWTAADLWGIHRAAPYHRLDCAGLLIMQGDAELRALEATLALFKKPSGNILRHTRSRYHGPECCLAWQIVP